MLVLLLENGLKLTREQLEILANDVSNGHDKYNQAFSSPDWGDVFGELECKYKKEIIELKKESNEYRTNSEMAIKRILNLNLEDHVCIDRHGFINVD